MSQEAGLPREVFIVCHECDVHISHLGMLLKYRLGLGRSGVEPETLHFYQPSADADAAGPR